MKLHQALIALWCILWLSQPVAAQSQLWKSYESQADKSAEAHDDRNAVKLYQAALQEAEKTGDTENRLESMLMLGDCNVRLGEFTAAEKLYDQSLKLAESHFGVDSNHAEFVLTRLGQVYLIQKNLVEAERALRRALKIEQEHPTAAKANLLKTIDNYNLTFLPSGGGGTPVIMVFRHTSDTTGGALHKPTPIIVGDPVDRQLDGDLHTGSSHPIAPHLLMPTIRNSLLNPTTAKSARITAKTIWNAYLDSVELQILKHWFPPKRCEAKRVVLVFRIHRQGEMSNLHVDHGCGVPEADNAALKAILDAAPFRPLPADSPDFRDVQFTFDYNVFAGHGSGFVRTFGD